MGFEIRAASPEDAGFLAWAVVESARSHVPRGFWDLLVPDSDAARIDFVAKLLLAERASWWHWTIFYIAELDGAPAATLSGFDPAVVQSPNDAVPAAIASDGWTDAQTQAAFTRASPMFGCMIDPTPGAWLVESVATRPAARGHGLAQALVAHVQDEGRRRGLRKAELTLMIGNTAAQRVYERAGFAITAEKRDAAFEAAIGCPGLAKMSCPL
jgi:translation initiation factor 4G